MIRHTLTAMYDVSGGLVFSERWTLAGNWFDGTCHKNEKEMDPYIGVRGERGRKERHAYENRK